MAEAVKSEDIKALFDYIVEREKNLSRYSDKLRQAVKTIVDVFKPQRINVSIDVIDDEPFFKKENEEEYYLAIKSHYLRVRGVLSGRHPNESGWDQWLEEMSREALKSLIKSGRLLPFLNKVAEELAKAEENYKRVSEVAEEIALAIKP